MLQSGQNIASEVLPLKNFFALIFIFCLSFSLVACQSSESADSAQEASTKPYKIGVLTIDDSLPFHVADKEGLFKKAGLNVEIIPFKSSQEEAQAFESGELDMIMNDMIVQSTLKKAGIDTKVISIAFGATKTEGRFAVLAKKDSEIKKPEDFYGKKIAISTNTMMEYLIESYFNDALKLDSTKITFVNIPNLGTRLETLLSGKDIDGAILPDPLASLAALQGAKVIIDDTTLNDNYSQSVLLVKDSTIQEKKQQTKLVLDKVYQAMNEINQNPEKYQAIEREFSRIPEPLTDAYPMPKYTPKALPTEEQVARIQAWLVKKNLIEKESSYTDMVDKEFIGD